MKILEIRIKNLNSLKGEWTIDLTHNDYISNGIFAITGPTGAGKTTIFDAVCLALYAQTPRLGRIGGKISNEIMSRRTQECGAVVIFEAGGEKYSCEWQQAKGGKKLQLQDVKHTLSKISTGEILSDKTQQTQKLIEDITGMNFQQFTQSVMLEQGEFDAFLKANAGERSRILEIITGTEIYGTISTKVYEQTEDEKNKLREIQIERDGKKPLDNFGTDEEISRDLAQSQEEFSKLEHEHAELKNSIDWLKDIAKIQRDIDILGENLRSMKVRAENFTGEAKKLDAGLRAKELETDFAELINKRKQAQISKARCEKLSGEISNGQRDLQELESVKIPELEQTLKKERRNTSENPDVLCAKIKNLARDFARLQSEARKLQADRAELENAYKKAAGILKQRESELERHQKIYDDARNKYDDMLNNRAGAILDQTRDALQEGEPCPVCGSREHPGINHSESERNSKAKIIKFDAELRKLKQDGDIIRKNLDDARKQETQSRETFTLARNNLEHCEELLREKINAYDEAKKFFLEALAPLGIFDVKEPAKIAAFIEAWAGKINQLENSMKIFTDKINYLRPYLENAQKNFQSERSELEIISGELETLEKNFAENLRAKNFPDENSFLAARLQNSELENLQARKKEIDDEMQRLHALIANDTEKLSREQEKNITMGKLEELAPAFKEQEAKINALGKKIFALENAQTQRKKLRAELEKLNEKYNAQEKIYSHWAGLCELVGQKDGGKFRKFAQKITLEMMISLANLQLEKLNGRYILKTTPDDDGLSLSVIDKEQAGEIRTTKNLSGGERFIISLALALGLSQISGSKARVDSLFLDEGFGSLDEEALNTALEALGEVKRDGRMIGIISHVQALKERIATQINVIPKREGVSVIKGPGCSGGKL